MNLSTKQHSHFRPGGMDFTESVKYLSNAFEQRSLCSFSRLRVMLKKLGVEIDIYR